MIGCFLKTNFIVCVWPILHFESIDSFYKNFIQTCFIIREWIDYQFGLAQILMDSEFPDKSAFRDCE